jgi:hypothetical protein
VAVFAKKEKKEPPKDLTIAGMQGRKPKLGEVGIEIECETSVAGSLPKGANVIAEYWRYERDGSLRGADNGEYVLTKPVNFDKVDEAVDKLWAEFEKSKVKLNDSVRTSVHAHLNVMPFYQNRLAALLGLWFIFEEVLSYWCGDHRVGNLFCIRAKDGESIIRQIKGWVEAKGKFPLNNEALHYSALNMAALNKYGSIEIRTMHGPTTPEPVKQWIRILKKLYDASADYDDPRTLIEKFSLAGPYDFLTNIFQEESDTILRNIGDLDVRDSLFEGMRFAQEVIYARDWSDFRPAKIAIDPFGRRPSKEASGTARRTVELRGGRELNIEVGEYDAADEPEAPRGRRMNTTRAIPADWLQREIQHAQVLQGDNPFGRN